MHLKQLIALTLISTFTLSSTQKDPVLEIAKSNNQFAFEFYQEVAEDNSENLFFSPNSISTALAMTYAGANGITALEMESVMHFHENSPVYHQQYSEYLNRLNQNAKGNIQLRIANQLWGEVTYPFLPEYLSLLNKAYHAPLEKVDFINQPEQQRTKINNWVERKTEGKINDILPAGTINKATRLVLANAIYFKGDWQMQFDEKETKDKKFNNFSGGKSKVPFMHKSTTVNYFENETIKTIQLPYKGEKQSMILALPQEGKDMKDLQKEIDQELLTQIMSTYGTEVEIAIPKFKLEQSLNLSPYLKKMGIEQAFSKRADFSKMTAKNDLHISEALHKAFIEVDEKGTEAAAATVIVMAVTTSAVSMPTPPKTFIADQPFVFYIVDNATQSILFMGRIMEM